MIHGAIIIVCAVAAGIYLDKHIAALEAAVVKLIDQAKAKL